MPLVPLINLREREIGLCPLRLHSDCLFIDRDCFFRVSELPLLFGRLHRPRIARALIPRKDRCAENHARCENHSDQLLLSHLSSPFQ